MRKRYEFEEEEEDSLNTDFLDGSKTARTSIHSIPVIVAYAFILLLLGIYGLVYFIDSRLPTPLNLADEKTYPAAFITARAKHDLKLLTSIGPRVAGGYENEILAAEFLKREIGFITQTAHSGQQIELDVQVVTGAHYLNTTPVGKIVAYSNLQNIVVKLHSRNNSAHSLLINSHFDSVPTSPGGTDDGINCAVMLEILRKLSKEPQRPLHNVIFLFNGAEETGLQAAHGFITQHKWAKESKVVINLDAAGAGGRIILFQSGPDTPWLMKYYNKVPHPYGQAAGEEIFQSNIIPSDTDFRIFRDYGGLIGFDMAFIKNGYRYHTKYDDFAHIPDGSFQHVGDNTLSLVRDIANAPELGDTSQEKGRLIYFDVMGLFMVSYTQTTAYILNFTAVIASFITFIWGIHSFNLGYNRNTLKYLLFTFGAVLGGWVLAILTVFLLGLFIDRIGYSMSWYANPWIIFGLYVAPGVAISSMWLPRITYDSLSENVKAHVQAHVTRIIWTVLLFAGTLANIRTMYALLLLISFNVLAFVIIYLLKLQHTVRKWQIIYVLCTIIPAVLLMFHTLTTLSLFIPITGRIGSDKNADVIIGLMSLFFTILVTSPFVAIVTLVRNFKYFIIFLGAIFVISFIILLTPLGFPYSGNPDSPAAQRYWVVHTRRVVRSEMGQEIKRDSGYFILDMDRNSPTIVKNYVKDLKRAKSLEEDCRKYLLCGLPLVHSKMIQIIHRSTWVPSGQPIIPQQTKLEVLSKVYVTPTILRYNISISGPDRMGLYFSPKIGAKVLKISLIEQMPPDDNTQIWNDRQLYFILHIWGKEEAALRFTFDVEIPENSTEPTTEIAVSGIHVHESQMQKVPHYIQFLSEFPEWADMTAWLGSYESWWI